MRRCLAALALALALPLPVLSEQVTVKPGETLSEIAERHNVSLSRLMKLNGISNPDHVEVGQRLTLPGSGGGGGAQARAAGGRVTVQEGDTLSEIAERHGMSMKQLMALNGLKDADHVEVGQTLRVKGTPGAGEGGGTFTYRKGASTHTVRRGESLSRIAEGYGVHVDRLVALNQIEDPDKVHAGTRLRLTGTPPAPRAAQPAPRVAQPAPQPAATAPAAIAPAESTRPPAPRPSVRPAATTAATSRPAAAPRAAAPAASTPVAAATTVASATTAGTWRTYGPLKVDWSNWQPMADSLVAPTLNAQGQAYYLAVNCGARKINATTPDGQWQTWNDPLAAHEQKLVSDLCRSRPR